VSSSRSMMCTVRPILVSPLRIDQFTDPNPA
jgi:hypothetical protein